MEIEIIKLLILLGFALCHSLLRMGDSVLVCIPSLSCDELGLILEYLNKVERLGKYQVTYEHHAERLK